MKTVNINRNKWLRGFVGGKNSLLCNKDNQKCCLGHAITQITKYPNKKIKDQSEPSNIFNRQSFLTIYDKECHLALNNEFAEKAISINDQIPLTAKERESKLKKLFRENGIKLKFYGKTTFHLND